MHVLCFLSAHRQTVFLWITSQSPELQSQCIDGKCKGILLWCIRAPLLLQRNRSNVVNDNSMLNDPLRSSQ